MSDDGGKGRQEKELERTKERNGKDIMHLKTKELEKKEIKGFCTGSLHEYTHHCMIFVVLKRILQQPRLLPILTAQG